MRAAETRHAAHVLKTALYLYTNAFHIAKLVSPSWTILHRSLAPGMSFMQQAYDCNDAMRHAFKDHKIFQEIERTSEDEFVKNAYHSVLHDGIYLKRKLREFNGKNTRPHFYQKGKRISPKCITGGSIIQVVVQFKTYCFKGENGYIYGVRGELQKEIEIISLNDHISNKPPLPYIPFEI